VPSGYLSENLPRTIHRLSTESLASPRCIGWLAKVYCSLKPKFGFLNLDLECDRFLLYFLEQMKESDRWKLSTVRTNWHIKQQWFADLSKVDAEYFGCKKQVAL
jgi:hypothetical protein